MAVSMKRVPERMCVACREMKPKKELARVVKSPAGEISVDVTGKAGGRGAYICHSVDCLLRARKTRALERALSSQIDAETYERLSHRLQEVTGIPVPELPPVPPAKTSRKKAAADG